MNRHYDGSAYEGDYGWAGPDHLVDGVPRAGGIGQWEPPTVVRVRYRTGIDTDGRYETGKVY